MQTVQIALGAIGANEISRIAQNFQLRKNNVESAINLLLEGKSPSFIARYRRAKTAGMNESVIRAIRDRLFKIKTFHDRREMILKALETQGKLTEELRLQILAVESPKRLEDLYLPLKPRKSILAAGAREKGLEPFAEALWTEDPSIANLDEILPTMINPEKGLETIEKITEGVVQILAEKLSEIPAVRASVRNDLWDFGSLRVSKTNKVRDKHGLELKEFFSYVEPLRNVQARKYLQIGKGEKNGFLNVLFDWNLEQAKKNALESLVEKPVSQSSFVEQPVNENRSEEADQAPEVAPAPEVKAAPAPVYTHKYVELIKKAMSVAVDQILKPVLERECVRDLGERASEHAASLLARFYHNRLVANPAGAIKILAIDPGFRNGCKIAVINEEGKLIDHAIIFPHQPQGKKELSLLVLEELIRKHQISTIALDNGNASKATEALLYELITRLKNPKHLEEDNKEILPTEEASEKGGTDETVAESAEAPAAEAPAAEAPAQISTPVVPEPVAAVETPAAEVSSAEVAPVTATDGTEPTAEALAAAKKAELAALAVIKRAELEAQAAKKKAEIEAQKKLEKERRQAEYQKLVNDTKATIKPLPEAPAEVKFATVIEAGSSEYASSILGKEELADSDVGVRAAVSIGRRLQNPLNELIKIDPVHIVSGLVEFEVQHRYLRPALDNVLESCVNLGGADLNKCEASYLRHLSGLNQLLAQEIVEHRKKNGPYKNRAQLLEVPGLTPEKFELCAGFLQVHDGDEPFDATNFHPEDYEMAKKILDAFGITKDEWKTPEKKQELLQKAIDANLKDIIATTGIDSVTSLKDFLDELINPLSQEQIKRFGPVYRIRQLDFEELQLGQELPGVVQNVVEFGCFVDVGIKESGLVHISQISARYVRSPYESVSVGDIVTVWVIALDKEKSRLSLTMINPNRESDHQGSGRSSRAPARDYPRRSDRRPDSNTQNAEANNQGGDSQSAPLRPRSPERPAGRFPAARSNSGGSSSGGGSAGSSRSSSSFRPRDDKPRGARPPRLDPNRPPQIRTFSSQKPIEKPNLSQSALSGDSPLGTFAELAVFWEKSTPNDAGETKKGVQTQNQSSPPAPQKDQEGNGSPE
jgi:uncharacterized protein